MLDYEMVAIEEFKYRRVAIEMLRAVIIGLTLFLAGTQTAMSRSWSYHYQPGPAPTPVQDVSPEATPLAAPSLSKAQLLKQKIISDLAISAIELNNGSMLSRDRENRSVVRMLAAFDEMKSPDDLQDFVALSDYYLGTRLELLYDCIFLRKGVALKPYIDTAIRQQDTDCARDFGEVFLEPNDRSEGRALCATPPQRTAHLRALTAQIDAGRSCSDRQLATLIEGTRAQSSRSP